MIALLHKRQTKRTLSLSLMAFMLVFSIMSFASASTGINAYEIGDDYVKLSWDTGTAPYTLDISYDNGATFTTLETGINETQRTVSGLDPETTYVFKVTDSAATPLTSSVTVTTTAGQTPSGMFSDMLSLAVEALPWFVVIMLISALIRKVK